MGLVKRVALAVWLIVTITDLMSHATGYRLPKDIIPILYEVELIADVDNNFDFEGIVKIDVKAESTTNKIVLHSNGLEILQISIDGNTLSEDKYELPVDDRHFLTINLDNDLTEGQESKIEIHFKGKLAEDMYGFYTSSYDLENGIKSIAATQFQPTHARRVFPCFDEPEFKARFRIQLTVPPTYHALGNTPLEEGYPKVSEDIPNWLVYKYEETGLMSSYLIAFIVSDFESLTDPANKYSFSAWARKEAIEKAEYSQEVGPKLVDWFEEYTEISYTFPKIDQVALPDFAAGAMENWGLITYRETGLLYYEEATTESSKKYLAMVVAHELAHMWWGNLITLEWWSETWLNEGFARYFQYFATSHVEDTWRLMDQFLVDMHHTIFGTDALASAQALTSDCQTPGEIMAKFTSISYNKGASILRMISHILTPEVFRRGLVEYLKEHTDSNTVPQHLFDALDNVRSDDPKINEFLPKWTTQRGYPVITVIRNGDSFTVSQKRFLLKSDGEDPTETWWVPLTWTKESQAPGDFEKTQPTIWLSDSEVSKDITIDAAASEWVIFNNQEAGYYRVNYDGESWKLIIEGLQNNRENFHVLNRAQLVDDALNLARADQLDYEIALEVVHYLHEEDDYIPWATAFNALSFLDRKLSSEAGHEYFKTYIHSMTKKTYDSVGFEIKESDGHIEHLHRASLLSWACRFDNADCVSNARSKFNEYKEDATKLVPANLRSVVYCTALREGGPDDWDHLWNDYVNSRIAAEKVTLLSALGCTENEILLKDYLQKSIEDGSGIRKQDAASVFSAVYSNAKGVDVAFDFLTENYNAIAQYYGGMNALSNVLTGIASRLTTSEQVDRLEAFIEEHRDNLGSAAEAGENAIESAKADLEWTTKHKEKIINWYRGKVDPTPDSTTTTVSTTTGSTTTGSTTTGSTTTGSTTTGSTTTGSTTTGSTTTGSTTTGSTTGSTDDSSPPGSTEESTTEGASTLGHISLTIVLICTFIKKLLMY